MLDAVFFEVGLMLGTWISGSICYIDIGNSSYYYYLLLYNFECLNFMEVTKSLECLLNGDPKSTVQIFYIKTIFSL